MSPENKHRYTKINFYLGEGEEGKQLRRAIRIAAAHKDVSMSEYCLEAIKQRLAEEGFLQASQ